MAVYHLSCKPVQRSKGRSCVAAAAYRAGQRLRDERQGMTFNYSARRDVRHAELIGWSGTRESLWNCAEAAEKRVDGTTAKEFEVALPVELPYEGQVNLARQFARWLHANHRCAVDFAIHDPGEGNPHAHVLTTTREVSEAGGELGPKCEREWSDARRKKHGLPSRRTELQRVRKEWQDLVNTALDRVGAPDRVDHRTLAEQGMVRVPGTHLGPARWRALRERARGAPAKEIAFTDRAIHWALKVRQARKVEGELRFIEQQISQIRNANGRRPMINPVTGGSNTMSEKSSRPTPTRNLGDREPQQHQGHHPQLEGKLNRQIPFMGLPEGQLAVEETFDERAIAAQGAVSPMGSMDLLMWPCLHHLPLLLGLLIRTRTGHLAVAYRLKSAEGAGRPLMVDFGQRIVCYSSDPQDQKLAVNAMLQIAGQRGWSGIRWRGDREFLRRAVIESERAGRKWTIGRDSAYVPTPEEIGQWRAEGTEARGGGGSRAPNGASPSEEEREQNARPFKEMNQEQLVQRALLLRRKLGKEFADDGEVEHGRPR